MNTGPIDFRTLVQYSDGNFIVFANTFRECKPSSKIVVFLFQDDGGLMADEEALQRLVGKNQVCFGPQTAIT